MRTKFYFFMVVTTIMVFTASHYWKPILWSFVILIPIFIQGLMDILQTTHTLRKNFPVLGILRYLMEDLRPKIYQYFIESEVDGTPINRMRRSVVYQRAKGDLSTSPFGTKINVNETGYEWANHSMHPLSHQSLNKDPRVLVGGSECTQPYDCSILNISGMSFGALSSRAIEALNAGAKKGNFAHNTGEGSISDYHIKHEGDLIWQIGTGYFGCRNEDGTFNAEMFREKATMSQVKMIEIKLSQGAKPGHGGILPAIKNTEEIARIRSLKPHVTVDSPPAHNAFSNQLELLQFIKQLRELSGGKPIGFKLCVGNQLEFTDVCIAMVNSGIKPDFITVDGGEGGTGAAPLEFSNHIGMPLLDAIAFVSNSLKGYGLKDEIMIFASGKIITGFDIFKAVSLGADGCHCARAMMLALGCIQALECHNNNCPTGIATQKNHLVSGLDVKDKTERISKFHNETVKSFVEFMGATGLKNTRDVKRHHVCRRIDQKQILTYADIYPAVKKGSLL